MSRLVRLYPAAWRERYEVELRAALATRPLTRRDRYDLVRGAVDARLHPELGEPPPMRLAMAGPGGGSIEDDGRGPFPLGPFLAVTAAGALTLAAGLIVFRASWMWGSTFGESLLLTLAALALGGAYWVTGAGAPLIRLGGVVMVGTALVLIAKGWSTDSLTGLIALALGGAVAGLGGLVHRRLGWSSVLLLVLTVVAVAWSVEHLSLRRWPVAFAGLGLIALRIALPDLRPRRRTVMAAAAGITAVAVVMSGLAIGNPWFGHDGYSVGCHVDRAQCLGIADRMAGSMRTHFPDARVLAIEVRADGQVWACWRDSWQSPLGGCRLGDDDGWPATLPYGQF